MTIQIALQISDSLTPTSVLPFVKDLQINPDHHDDRDVKDDPLYCLKFPCHAISCLSFCCCQSVLHILVCPGHIKRIGL